MTSFREALDARLRRDPGQPLVTFYDDATGERTELSVTTYANWVAKTAGVLVEDLDLGAGDRLAVDLPTHWLGPVFLGAAWTAGVAVAALAGGVPADAVVEGPDGSASTAGVRLRCALLPFAVASREPVPAGTLDFGTLWPGQPDVFLGVPGGPGDPAYGGRDQAGLLAATEPVTERVLTDAVPTSPEGVEVFLGTLLGGGSTVWVARPAPERWAERATAERATSVRRTGSS